MEDGHCIDCIMMCIIFAIGWSMEMVDCRTSEKESIANVSTFWPPFMLIEYSVWKHEKYVVRPVGKVYPPHICVVVFLPLIFFYSISYRDIRILSAKNKEKWKEQIREPRLCSTKTVGVGGITKSNCKYSLDNSQRCHHPVQTNYKCAFLWAIFFLSVFVFDWLNTNVMTKLNVNIWFFIW